MTDRTAVIAQMAWEAIQADSHDPEVRLATEAQYIAAAIAFYQATEQAVKAAYATTSVPLEKHYPEMP